MNNEEKILRVLEQMQGNIEQMQGELKQVKEQQEQTNMRLDVMQEQTNKRFDIMQEQTNMRFDVMQEKTNKRFDIMQEQTNKRFDNIENDIREIKHFSKAIFDQTANLTEFHTDTTNKLNTIIEDNISIKEVIGEHEISIRSLRRRPV